MVKVQFFHNESGWIFNQIFCLVWINISFFSAFAFSWSLKTWSDQGFSLSQWVGRWSKVYLRQLNWVLNILNTYRILRFFRIKSIYHIQNSGTWTSHFKRLVLLQVIEIMYVFGWMVYIAVNFHFLLSISDINIHKVCLIFGWIFSDTIYHSNVISSHLWSLFKTSCTRFKR